MITIKELETQLKKLQDELYICIRTHNDSETARILIGIGAIKDTLLESYRKTHTGGVVCPVVASNVNVTKYTPPNFARPLRSVK